MTELCDVCDRPWDVRFSWDYTYDEHYCLEHLLTPIEGQPDKTLLDYLPDCQRITCSTAVTDVVVPGNPRALHLASTAALQTLLRQRKERRE